jgi:hypothetical protein
VRFDEKGRVAGVARLGLDEAREVEIVERTTPTASNEMSVLQQLLGNIGRFTDQGPRPGPGP